MATGTKPSPHASPPIAPTIAPTNMTAHASPNGNVSADAWRVALELPSAPILLAPQWSTRHPSLRSTARVGVRATTLSTSRRNGGEA
ncbi:hypothetical protein VTK73DRAFT_4963 [Phialemonium thermophilum]|uniref:Uncharacterized protein n=1 Tax=Phialemonium thermophilum TaxID=223376 RepID=A0ABR3V4H3_9PEZI